MNKKFYLRSVWLLICLLLFSLSSFSQGGITIAGTVTDKSTGETLPGVSVKLKGNSGSVGTATDPNGKFSLKGIDARSVLIVSFVGYSTQEVSVNGRTAINIALVTENATLNDVIVIGYGTTTRQDITTSVSKVDPKKISTAANTSVPELLFGRAAGVQVTQQSSQPGGNVDISIRGKGTPLYVVDGVVYPSGALEAGSAGSEIQGVNRGSLLGLNPNDIESIELLKDASAAIYGVSASNGVVLITTKKGRSGMMNITYDGNYSFVNNMEYLNTLNATDYMTYYNQLDADKWLSDRNMAPFGTVPANLSGYTSKFTSAQISAAGVGTNWLDQVFRRGGINNHNFGINGGSDKLVYYFSGNYFGQKGTLKESDLERFTGRMNLTFTMNKVIKLNASVNINRNNYTNPQAGWQSGGGGNQNLNALQAALAYPAYVPVYDNNGNYSIFQVTGNPLQLLEIRDASKTNGTLANISADFNIIQNELTARLAYGNNYEASKRDFYIPSTVLYGNIYRSNASLQQVDRQNQTMEASISYKKKLTSFLSLDAVTGVGRYLSDYSGLSLQTTDIMDAINTENVATGTGPKIIGSYNGENQTRKAWLRTSFNFLDRYLFTFAGSYDGSDKFFPNQKFQLFPSVSGAWKVSSEKFFESIKFINLLKFRASYGTTGDSPGTSAYGVFGPDVSAITFNSGGISYIPYRLNALDNPDLRWPVNKTLDVGLDFGLLKDRISGSFDIFKEERTRLVADATTAQLSLLGTSPVNGGHQRRTGFDLSLNSTNIKSNNFTWTTTANLSSYKNRWVERFAFDPIPRGGALSDPIGTIYVYQTSGILQVGQNIPSTQPNGARKPGSPLFVDQNADGLLDDNDIVKYSGIPNLLIGFGNSFSYKNFDFSIFLYGQTGAYGNDFSTQWGDPLGLLSGLQNGTERIKDAWSRSNPSGTLPGAAYNESNVTGLNAGIDTRLTSKDFLRCRNITLGYTFPQTLVKSFAKSLKVFADVQNAFIITNYKGIDPEIQAVNTKGGPAPYPMARTISLGVKANF